MTKQQFMEKLQAKLAGISQKDIDERISFYNEMIEDRIEEGCSEEEAVAQIGSVDEIYKQIVAEMPFTKLIKEKLKLGRKLSATEIVLIVLGFPLWLPLLLGAVVVVIALYVSFWTVIVSFWSGFVALVACAFGGGVGGVLFLVTGRAFSGVVIIALSLISVGLSIFAFYVCKIVTTYALKAGRFVVKWLKHACVQNKKQTLEKEEI